MRLLAYIVAVAFLVAALGAASNGALVRAALHLVVAIALALIACKPGAP